MSWRDRATQLATSITHPHSRWHTPVATLPRHEFVPAWWSIEHQDRTGAGRWSLHCGTADREAWLETAYADRSVVTSAAGHHADHATAEDHPVGKPTSSATLPSLLVRMYQHAHLDDGMDVLDVGTGSGYGTALLCPRLGDDHVTSVDVDPYLTTAARDRLAAIGLPPRLETLDATQADLPATCDRIVATVTVRPIPPAWMRALRPGGRVVTTIAGTTLIIVVDMGYDGYARGHVTHDPAGFMRARVTPGNYPAGVELLLADAWNLRGEDITHSRYPVLDVANAWDIASMLDLTAPGIAHDYRQTGTEHTAVMAHPDGSWARASATGVAPARVHQGGPRRLWDLLDHVRADWLATGDIPIRGARVRIKPDGTTQLASGDWHATL